jgi:hypothetical protein
MGSFDRTSAIVTCGNLYVRAMPVHWQTDASMDQLHLAPPATMAFHPIHQATGGEYEFPSPR